MLLHTRYEILAQIGHGGSGEVFQVLDHHLQMHFASKRIALQDQNSMSMVHHEIEVLSKLHHAGIPRIIDQFEEEGYAYIIMDLIDGVPLMDYLVTHALINETMLLDWMEQIADIFCYLHAIKPSPLLYLDLKPQNIMADKQGKLYLIDFGSSTLKSNACISSATPGYAPDEVMKHHKACQQSDIYSFGITFYVLLHGHFPKGSQKLQPLDKLLLKCSMSEIKKRYDSFDQIKKAITYRKMQKSRYMMKIILTLTCAVLSFFMGCYQFYQLQAKQDEDYLKAMNTKDYLRAIQISPTHIEPYQSYYTQTCTTKESCIEAFSDIEEIALHMKQTKNSQIAWFLGMKAIELQSAEGYQKAEMYLSYVKPQNVKEREAIHDLLYITNFLTSSGQSAEQLKKLEQAMQGVKIFCASIKDISRLYLFEKVLLILYDVNHTRLVGSEDAIIHLCDKMANQLQTYPHDLKLSENSYLEGRRAYAYYYKGLNAYEKKDYEAMIKAYERSISAFQRSNENERYVLMANMYINIFEYGVSDIEKKNNLHYLQQASEYAKYVPYEDDRLYLQELIARRIAWYRR